MRHAPLLQVDQGGVILQDHKPKDQKEQPEAVRKTLPQRLVEAELPPELSQRPADSEKQPALGLGGSRFLFPGDCLRQRPAEPGRRDQVSLSVQFVDADPFAPGLFLLVVPIVFRFVHIGRPVLLVMDIDQLQRITSSFRLQPDGTLDGIDMGTPQIGGKPDGDILL